MPHLIFHVLAYYLAWFACILLAAKNQGGYAFGIVMAIAVLQIFWQIFVAKRTRGLGLMIALFTLLGTLSDTLLMKCGLLRFSSDFFNGTFSPPWMISLWIIFSVTFYAVLDSFYKRYLLLSLLSFIFFPLAYLAGAQMKAAQFPHGYVSSIIVGFVWALLFPLCLKIYNHCETQHV